MEGKPPKDLWDKLKGQKEGAFESRCVREQQREGELKKQAKFS